MNVPLPSISSPTVVRVLLAAREDFETRTPPPSASSAPVLAFTSFPGKRRQKLAVFNDDGHINIIKEQRQRANEPGRMKRGFSNGVNGAKTSSRYYF